MAQEFGEGAEILHASRDIECACLLYRAPGIGHFGGDELLETPFDAGSDAQQSIGAFACAGAAPGAGLCGPRRQHGTVHHIAVGLANFAEHTPIDRRNVSEVLCAGDEFAIDVVAQQGQRRQHEGFHERTQGASLDIATRRE